jgi:hypothetical protein
MLSNMGKLLIKQKKRNITMYVEKNQSSLLKNQFVIFVLKKNCIK